MIVYFSVLLLILLSCYIDKSKYGLPGLIFSLALIVLMIVLQTGWGGDGETYEAYFNYYNGRGFSWDDLKYDERHGEIGFKYAFAILPSYEIVRLVFSVYFAFALFLLLFYIVPRRWWPLFFFFMFIDRPMLMGTLCALPRTGMAVSSFIIGLFFLKKGKRLYYIAILILASFFHRSALIFLPLVLIPNRKNNIQPVVGVIILLFIALISVLTPSTFVALGEKVIMSSDQLDQYTVYIDGMNSEKGLSLLLLFLLFWGYVIFYMSRSVLLKDNDYFIIYITLLTVILYMLPDIGLSARLFYFFDYAFFAGMMIMIEKFDNNDLRWALIGSLIFVFGRWFLMFYSTPYFKMFWLEYNFIF